MTGTLLDKYLLLQAIIDDPRSSKADIRTAKHLLNGVNSKTGIYYAARATIAQATGQGERNLMRCVDRLAAWGYFRITESAGRGKRRQRCLLLAAPKRRQPCLGKGGRRVAKRRQPCP
jgi:hypothetical protein